MRGNSLVLADAFPLLRTGGADTLRLPLALFSCPLKREHDLHRLHHVVDGIRAVLPFRQERYHVYAGRQDALDDVEALVDSLTADAVDVLNNQDRTGLDRAAFRFRQEHAAVANS